MVAITRRKVLITTASAIACSTSSLAEGATDYPVRAIKLVSPYAAGGATDTIARIIGSWLSDRLGTGVVVENKPGGGANIGTESVVRAQPDGYTLLMASTANAVNTTLFPKLSFDFLRDTVAVAKIGDAFNVLLVHPSTPFMTAADFLAHLRAKPNTVTIGLPGNGSPQHMSAELFKLETETTPVFVQYRGAPAVLNDLIGGHINACFASSVSAAEFIKSRALRPLGVTTAARTEAFPEVPTLSETIPGFEALNFYGIVAPKETPENIVLRLNTVINAGLADRTIRTHLATIGVLSQPTSPAQFLEAMREETEKWRKVVRTANLQPT